MTIPPDVVFRISGRVDSMAVVWSERWHGVTLHVWSHMADAEDWM